ncbi:DUF805 domain-containing protein [Arsenophonus endosymbiont of Aphis craccivora]|uniref:DUF805 domain-containing protein n=1 Tax=Arsenophonus endosymbiont of Aphis craccivora TaxID=1231049 RepID=UPI0015DBDEFC|nr:DUF805 domain-containing protein [Arsenophonus endosymbiont of Aphis craccivora]
MTLQQWALSFKGLIGRKPFWLGMVILFLLMVMIFSLQTFLLFSPYILLLLVILLLYPLATIFTKRLHDRGKSGGWLLLLLNLVAGCCYYCWLLCYFLLTLVYSHLFGSGGLDDFYLYLLLPYYF